MTIVISSTSVPYVIQMTEKTPMVVVLNSGSGVRTTGGVIQTIQGPPGADGIDGKDGRDGIDGKDGTSVVLKGAVASIENLPSSDQTQGDLYVVTEDGNGYVWDGSQWVSCGPIRGPQGEQGISGSDGADGQDGAAGANGSSAYVYVAYASDYNGTGFTTTFNSALDYIAIKSTTSPLSPPVANHFTGLWKKYKGETGAKGDTGATGGIDFSTFWKFSWDPDEPYEEFKGVSRNGSAYISKQANTGQDPATDTDEVYWGLWVSKGDPGA